MSKATIHLEADEHDADRVTCTVTIHDEDCIGHQATITLSRKVHVKDRRAIHSSKRLWSESFQVSQRKHQFFFRRFELGRGFAYSGKQIDLCLESELKIDDAILFDTKVSGLHRLKILDKPEINGKATELAEPKDRFNFFANLQAIPSKNKLITLGLCVVGGIVVVINALVGLHDQFSPEHATYFYSHTDGDGEGQSPLMNALMGSGAAGAGIWFAIRRQLRKYMDFELVTRLPDIRPDAEIRMDKLIKARARVPLRNIKVRVVAYNREMGQYKRGSGTSERTVSFKTPSRAVILYEQHLSYIPAHTDVQGYLNGAVDFNKMFRSLYPPFQLSSSHGLDVQWEVQLLHPKFVDHDAVAPDSGFKYTDFLSA